MFEGSTGTVASMISLLRRSSFNGSSIVRWLAYGTEITANSHHRAASAFVPAFTWSPAIFAASIALAASREPIMTSCPVERSRTANASPSFPVPPIIDTFIEIDLFPALLAAPLLCYLIAARQIPESTPQVFLQSYPSRVPQKRPGHQRRQAMLLVANSRKHRSVREGR